MVQGGWLAEGLQVLPGAGWSKEGPRLKHTPAPRQTWDPDGGQDRDHGISTRLFRGSRLLVEGSCPVVWSPGAWVQRAIGDAGTPGLWELGDTLGHGHQLGSVPGRTRAPVLGIHPGRETSSPALPGCGQGDAPVPRVLGADPSVSGKPARVGILVSSGCCNGRYRCSSSPVLEAGIPDPVVGRAGPPEASPWVCRQPSPPRVLTGSSL